MKRVKALNALLWVVNVVVGAAIVVFSFQYLVFPEQVALIPPDEEQRTGRERGGAKPPPTDFSPFRNLGNPIVPRTDGGMTGEVSVLGRVAKFLGGYRLADTEGTDVAFLLVTASGQNVNAYVGQPVTTSGQEVADLRGWKLVRLTPNGAVFSSGAQEVELQRDEAAASVGSSRPVEGAFDLSKSKTKRTNQNDLQESWQLDRAEIAWAQANIDQLLADVQLSAYPGGGVKIDATGAFAAQRGFMDNDVIKTINGMGVKDRADLITIANSPQMRASAQMVVIVERAGRHYTIDFRPEATRRQR